MGVLLLELACLPALPLCPSGSFKSDSPKAALDFTVVLLCMNQHDTEDQGALSHCNEICGPARTRAERIHRENANHEAQFTEEW